MIAMTHHAWDRMLEFGLSPDVVTEIATRPDVAHTNKAGESVRVCDRHPAWTVVVAAEGIVITVLRRTSERWEHTPKMPTPRSVPMVWPIPPGPDLGDADATMDPLRPVASRRRRRPTPALFQARAVVVSHKVEPCVLEAARRLADGDPRRLQINRDGTVTVLNKPRGSR